MSRRLALLFGLLVALVAGGAQAQGRTVRVAYVWLFDAGPSAPYSQPFRVRLNELGWKDGQNLRFEEYDAAGDFKRLDLVTNFSRPGGNITIDELNTALEMLEVDGTQGLLNAGDPMLSHEIPRIVKRTADLKIPTLWTEKIYPQSRRTHVMGA